MNLRGSEICFYLVCCLIFSQDVDIFEGHYSVCKREQWTIGSGGKALFQWYTEEHTECPSEVQRLQNLSSSSRVHLLRVPLGDNSPAVSGGLGHKARKACKEGSPTASLKMVGRADAKQAAGSCYIRGMMTLGDLRIA